MKTLIRHIENGKVQGPKRPVKKSTGHPGQFSIQIAFFPEAMLKKTGKGTKIIPNPFAPQFL